MVYSLCMGFGVAIFCLVETSPGPCLMEKTPCCFGLETILHTICRALNYVNFLLLLMMIPEVTLGRILWVVIV